MGSGSSAAGKKQREEEVKAVVEMKLLQKEMVFPLEEAEWAEERRRLREEVRRLRKLAQEKEEIIRGMEQVIAGSFFVRGMEERAWSWRDEAVDKWKKLYLAIKKELDDLILTGGVYCRAEEEELKRELQEKEGAIKALKMQLASAEYEGYKSKREVDILRQSLRIMSNNNKATTPNNIPHRK